MCSLISNPECFFFLQSRKSWIEETLFKRECVRFIPSSWDQHRCVPVCQICQNLIRCYCGRLVGEHSWQEPVPPLSFYAASGQEMEEDWSIEVHTRASPTNAYGTIDFEDTATRVCRAKYVRVAVDSKPEALLQLMLREWQMERPKLLLTVQGGTENFVLPPKVMQAFSKGLITAALSTGGWILTDGINTGVSKYVGEAVKVFGGHDLRKRNTVGITPWGVIDNNMDLIGRDVFKPYQPLGNPLSKRVCLNGFHSHFLLVDDGTLGKYGCQQGLRRKLEKHIQQQKIHPRLNQRVPMVCVVVEGGPSIAFTVLDYVSSAPPVPVFVFEGSGRAADLLSFLHKQTSDDQMAPDAAILSTTLKGKFSTVVFSYRLDLCTKASPAEQLNMALAWDQADIAQKDILVYGQHWPVGSLEKAMLDALVLDRVSFVKMLIDNGMTMSHFLTVERLEDLYNTPLGQTQRFLQHLVEDAKQTSLPAGYRLSLIDVGLVIEYLIGGAYRSSYTRKHFRAAYSRMLGLKSNSRRNGSRQDLQFFRTAQPYKRKVDSSLGDASLQVLFNFNDLFVWAVLQQRQQMALFLWQHGEEALARAIVGCKLYRSMAFEARLSSMYDNIAEKFKADSLEFGKLAVDVLDCAFRQNGQMAMKLLTSEMEAWSHFTCLQLAVSSCHRPFVSHSCTQTLLTDLWTGPLNMRKNSFMKMSYLCFLMLFSFVVLVKMENRPSIQEWLVIFYIVSTAVEKTREVLMSEPRKLRQKLKIWFSEYWNISDFVAILLFLVGFALRWHSDPYRTAGRIAYCLDIIFWFIRVLDLLAVNQHAGPYLTIITKMVNMFFIVVMMAIVLLSFGVSRKAILSPDEEPSWSLARDIVFQPYWMIFGEVYAGEIDPCAGGNSCPPASFLTSFLQAVYMFVQYIIMVNVLIAFFNNIYFDMASTSNKLWKYNRYRYIMTYQERPWLPPPLILLSHMALALRCIYWKLLGNTEPGERGSGLSEYYMFVSEEMSVMVGEISEKVNCIQHSLSELDCQMGQLQDLSALAVDTLTLLTASDSLQKEEARLAQCRINPTLQHVLPHSWTLPHRSNTDCDVPTTERNNLMRLAQTIPFTPVSIFGEEVSIYTLEEAPCDADADSPSASFWSSKGLSAILQPLSSEEGSLDGGLRQGCRMLCTWAEQDVLKPGLIYVAKAFKSEVVHVWQKHFPGSTALQLCLREIQQQRAAQKMMQVFNQIKPHDMHPTPRFLDVSLVLWHSNGQWLTIERNMTGDFRKYNNNTGEEITPCSSLEDMLLAFSHWTYEHSCKELLVLDIQGVGEELTDPTVIMADDQRWRDLLFGPDNLGVAAINGFLQKHTCNLCCHRLGLKDLRTRPTSSEISSEAGRISRKEE
uniref:non-specific serine/threonine protein kinase n=1 Tax=Oryzias sinensis TaxID=183150 RepID=A0A8C7YRE8_9TELE